ncbi:hypothetical protein [uncultured Alistipes sp.]|uniref:hypothetical protein n=1 Tax=uncultured Alistipes sp. TaxID=538949 RepID=UPI0025963941|nr:hypothetical protein [uncultured Alistipes sp.]
MEHEITTVYESLKTEVAGMRGELSRVLEYLMAKEEKERKGKEKKELHPQLPIRLMVTKEEAAAILLVSPRHLQRIRKKLGLKWKKVGRETHYYLKEIVDAIHATQCPWDSVAYEKALKRVTRLPRL